MGIVFIIGLHFPTHFYFNLSLPFFITTFLILLTLIPLYFKPRLKFSLSPNSKIDFLLPLILWFFFALAILIWNATIDLDLTGNLSKIGVFPWYLFPIRQGIAGLLMLIGLTYLFVRKENQFGNFKFLLLTLLAFFVVGKIMSYMNVGGGSVGYWEKRFDSFFTIPVSIFAAFALSMFSHKILHNSLFKTLLKHFRFILAFLLITLVLFSGFSSKVLYFDYQTMSAERNAYSNITNDELQALDYLKHNGSKDATVLGITTKSNRLASVFSGLNSLTATSFVLKPENPEYALKTIYGLDATYVYATHSDLNQINPNSYISHIMKYAYIPFQNNKTTIWKIPDVSPPESNSSLTLAVSSYDLDSISEETVKTRNFKKVVVFNETFEGYSEGSTGAPTWDVLGGTWKISNQTYTGLRADWGADISLISESHWSNIILQTEFNIAKGNYAGFIFRYVDSSNYLRLLLSADGKRFDLYEFIDGKQTVTSVSGDSLGDGNHTLRLEAIGENIIIYLDNKSLMSATVKSVSTGQVGLAVSNSQVNYHNIVIEELIELEDTLERTLYLPIDMLALSNLNYSIRIREDGAQFTSKFLMLSSSSTLTPKEYDLYLNWVRAGGYLIVLNGDDEHGYFEEELSIYSTSSVYVDQIIGNNENVLLPEMAVPRLSSSDTSVKIIAAYSNSVSGESSSFILSKKIGDGEVLYMNIQPIFNTILKIHSKIRMTQFI